jgi:hypothetical protein
MTFEGIELYDPAMYEETEQMFWRLDKDDGSAVTDWNFVGKVLPTQYEDFETGTGWPWPPWTRYGPAPYYESVHTGLHTTACTESRSIKADTCGTIVMT